MAQILDAARDLYEGEIDFKGQSLAEFTTYALLSVTGVVAFLAGFLQQDIYATVYVGLGGTALTFLLVVPPWPFYNRHALKWLPSATGKGAGSGSASVVSGAEGIVVDGVRIG